MSSPKRVADDPFVRFTARYSNENVTDVAYPRSFIKCFAEEPSANYRVVYLEDGGFFHTSESFNSILRRINE